MTPQTTTTTAEELVPEIEQALLASRADRARHESRQERSEPSDVNAHERAVMFDVTLALLIRHRLPIDADRAAKAVADAQTTDAHSWAAACARHIARVAEEKNP
ncbi:MULTISPECIES: hypothetical protein [Paenarthrobacter]|uniref:Uncharacterized protein n=1 Tax=Paenarthrobacter ureafaciens TaxID=37931 RepID=A0AAX3EDN3_PAEUR|nr:MULTISPECIES: hypothetical protein [Paenarthrobacter]NKR13295.1 hypothetical protein [Arthrobacter sp. M5]NKR14855.1 hypothetical protein [Arthrobacter sp. M6]OEH62407.1 hypothetical protein A5N13_01755 [Arthrobacter sp. D4]OEH62978.1 hypothetical protein A5N17_09995 [Arthrobacter sp. D2]MDO5865155.1 hypothetical protein [Paenarthrobacter sp. SD-2]